MRSSNVFENQGGLTKEALVGEKWKWLGKKEKKKKVWVGEGTSGAILELNGHGDCGRRDLSI